MPTLNRRVEDAEIIHPQQTDYYITAKAPEVGFITYQVDPRAVDFLTEYCGFEDQDPLPWSIVHPLRKIRDLYTLDEGRPRRAEPEDVESAEVTVPSLDSSEAEALVDYLNRHPDVTGDLHTFRTRLENEEGNYTDVIKREGYTPIETPGHEASGNVSLDRIAEEYFGDNTGGHIIWNGELVHDYIEVTDRSGTTHEFPRIDSRIAEGERYRFSKDLYERWGPQIGESEVNSRRYDPGEDGFPNRWIGQREGAPEPSLEDAESPRAFYYRTIAGRGDYAPGVEAEEAFESACQYSLEVYKANFPTAVDPTDLTTEYVTIEQAAEPWNDFQVPPGWIERYADNDGIPPLKQEPHQSLSSIERNLVERHSPGGDGPQWFSSIDEGAELVTDSFYGEMLIAAYQSPHEVIGFSRTGVAEPVFEVRFNTATATLVAQGERVKITFDPPGIPEYRFFYDGDSLNAWNFPDGLSLEESTTVFGGLLADLEPAIEFADTIYTAFP